jgi:hypothetical protein
MITVTTTRRAGEWIATAFLNGKYAASCACKSKKYATETARKDAADFEQRLQAAQASAPAPATAAPGQPAGRQGGAAKVGSFGLYISRPWSANALREAAETQQQLAPAAEAQAA